MSALRNILKHWFTGKDNESYEIMRALTALCVLVMLFYIGWHLIMNREFDPLASAGGLGALLFGGGAGTAAKDGLKPKTEINAGPDGNVNVNTGGAASE